MKINSKQLVAIAIPIHKDFISLSREEIVSLESCCKQLTNYPQVLFGPKKIDWKKYQEFYSTFGIVPEFKIFESIYFKDIEGYDLLLKCIDFYRKFRKYNYILIFQPDAFIFKDELNYWCNKGYDYIGAPWFEGYNLPISTTIIGVGNGGLSLRKVSGAIKISRQLRLLEILEEYKNFNWKGILPRLIGFLIKLIKQKNVPSTFAKNFLKPEDYFWTVGVGERLGNFSCETSLLKLLFRLLIKNNFKVAPPEIALQFSFEVHPAILYQMNNEKLPFGCHAWKKYDPGFWREFIPTTR